MVPNPQTVQQSAEIIWFSVLQLPLHATNKQGAKLELAAAVRISGAWSGQVTVSCTKAFATQAAAIMFALDPAETTALDLSDALHELVNMVGGNIKALVAEPSKLSLPFDVQVPGAIQPNNERHLTTNFDCIGQSVRIAIEALDAAGSVAA